MNIKKGIMKVSETDISVTYRVMCDSETKKHDTTIDFEYDKELNMIYINFYKDLMWSSHMGDGNFFTRGYRRIKCSLRVLFKGYIEVQESFIIRDIDHINNFIELLQEGRNKIIEKRLSPDPEVYRGGPEPL